jgi:hypothetical protein
MPKLVTDAALNGLRAIGIRSMDTPVDIYPRTLAETASDTVEAWPTKSASVLGWLRSLPAGSFSIDSGVVEASTVFRLFVPIDTVINPGDHLVIGGSTYAVLDTNVESTYLVMLRCSIRKFDEI